MRKNNVCITSITILTVYIICGNNLFAAKYQRQTTELIEAFARGLRFSPTLLGKEFTEEDEQLFTKSSKLKDVHLKLDEIIPKYGYAVEKHDVITEDGYILSLFRIPSSGRPIFLMHGLLLSADDWVTPGPESGIAYLLAAEGFDVWLGNARGNKHSRRHLHLSPESADFWDFSWDEIGRYDLPAMIDFILNTTQKTQLTYVGHSQGTTTFFVMGSEKPEYCKKVSLMIGLAAAGAIPNMKNPFLVFFKYATLEHLEILMAVIRNAGLNEFSPRDALAVMQVLATICVNSEIARAVCSNLVYVLSGFSYSQLNITTLPIILSHAPSGVSTKQIEHYVQTITFRRFQKFDNGATKNKLLYGTVIPPVYDVGAITTPLAIFYSADDWLTSERDVLNLRKSLNNVVDFYKVPDENFKHIDFLYSKNVKKRIFPRILKLVNNTYLSCTYNNGPC